MINTIQLHEVIELDIYLNLEMGVVFKNGITKQATCFPPHL